MNIQQKIFSIIIGLILAIPSHAITYEYDDLNRLSLAIYNNGKMLSYNYDAAGNLIDVIPMIECGDSGDDNNNGDSNDGATDGDDNSNGDSNDDTDNADDMSNTDDDINGEKVTICHIPQGNPNNAKTLVLPSSAIEAHFNHGDTLGICPNDNSNSLDKGNGKNAKNTQKRSTRKTRRVGCPIVESATVSTDDTITSSKTNNDIIIPDSNSMQVDLVIEEVEIDEVITDSIINIVNGESLQQQVLSPVYRFWSQLNKVHLFTIDETEKDHIIATYPEENWKYGGEAYNAYKAGEAPIDTSPVYRFWFPQNKTHFFTMNENEKNNIIATYPAEKYQYGGIAWYAYKTSDAPDGTSPVYRFWFPQNKTHFYTMNENEKNNILNTFPPEKYQYGGIAWYAYQ